jgi:hypothetical protein
MQNAKRRTQAGERAAHGTLCLLVLAKAAAARYKRVLFDLRPAASSNSKAAAMKSLHVPLILAGLLGGAAPAAGPAATPTATQADELEQAFQSPPADARPWVYWMFMDGNLSREGMTADLEAMQRAGIGGAIIMEVDLGIPRGPVRFMSQPWQAHIRHAIQEADRLGLQIALSAGPGWCGTGGPWVKPEQSMQHLVASETKIAGPKRYDATLPRPQPRVPFFGEATLTPALHKLWQDFYRDVAVLAFPTPAGDYRIPDVAEKALYFRAPYSSQPGVKPYLAADRSVLPPAQCLTAGGVLDLSEKLSGDGRLVWDAPPGNWTILRFGRTVTGQTTRPAPAAGLGFESDKFDKAALDAHFQAFEATLLASIGEPPHRDRGLTTIHFDSWEMSSQNWSACFREEFRRRRGYDPLRFLPAMLGYAVESVAVSERFLWDLRRTAQELVVENHALHLRELARRHGLLLSIEPYDLNPAGDLALGAAADVPMCEFWSRGFNTYFSAFEAVSLAHTCGRPLAAGEAFTSSGDAWQLYPGALKAQTDWALCAGVNRFTIHRYAHQPWLDRFPGMTFGPHGVHWERTETWWEMASGFHGYLARCQAMLRRGLPVADVLYLDAEGAPNVFRAPASATLEGLPDRRGYNFDACAPATLVERASVRGGRIVFPDGMSYRLLVLPRLETMTLPLLRKIKLLVDAGATVLGGPPKQSPSLENYPRCDAAVQALAAEIWRSDRAILAIPAAPPVGGLAGGGTAAPAAAEPCPNLYPPYEAAAAVLAGMHVPADFESDGDLRYTHRSDAGAEIYLVGNRTPAAVSAQCRFRATGLVPEAWDPLTGRRRALPEFREAAGRTTVPLRFEPGQMFFIVFRKGTRPAGTKNFPEPKQLAVLAGPWQVTFDPKWGGPEAAVDFQTLQDWTKRPEDGIRYYSGSAVYRKTFDAPAALPASACVYLDLGEVRNLARVRIEGRDLGIAWCAPWRVAVPAGLLKPSGNQLEIMVANLWCNRLIKDAGLPDGRRLTRTTWNPYQPAHALFASGLLGPVRILAE